MIEEPEMSTSKTYEERTAEWEERRAKKEEAREEKKLAKKEEKAKKKRSAKRKARKARRRKANRENTNSKEEQLLRQTTNQTDAQTPIKEVKLKPLKIDGMEQTSRRLATITPAESEHRQLAQTGLSSP